uniref:Nucleotide exchange factor GrpE n=1 Tax=Thermosporothrix sp. COM3 TaxID=2490863 RepID=A0A455SL71_9CHLR|nr:hypothetical protein KTC_16760 [Thermosporothrix sp. COM3]
MNSFPDWSAFQRRETLNRADEMIPPTAAIEQVLHILHSERMAFRQQQEASLSATFDLLAEQAVLLYQLDMLLARYKERFENAPSPPEERPPFKHIHKSLSILKEQMRDVLTRAGIEIIVPLGKTYADVKNIVEIEHWRHHPDYTEELVIEVQEPIIRMQTGDTVLIRQGRVIMGAPETAKEDA